MSDKRHRSESGHGHSNSAHVDHENGESPKRKDPITIATIVLDVLTLVAIGVAVWSTLETTHTQTENALLPIVVLAPEDTDAKAPRLVVRNIGFGPALNAETPPIRIPGQSVTMRFEHRTGVGANRSEPVRIFINGGLSPIQTTEELKAALTNLPGIPSGQICIGYENADREAFETWQTFSVTASNDLSIAYDRRTPVPTGQKACH